MYFKINQRAGMLAADYVFHIYIIICLNVLY